MEQFVVPLREHEIELDIRPFLSSDAFQSLYSNRSWLSKVAPSARSFVRRMTDAARAGEYDVLFVQREAMPFGPAMFEWLIRGVRRVPMVLDLDDATYVRYVSPTFGRVGSMLKFFGKTDKLIRSAAAVTCGNRFIAEYVEGLGSKAVVLPTVVDTKVFRPADRRNKVPVIGWIGTHSTFPSVESLVPVFKRLAEKHRFVLMVVGGGRDLLIEGVEVRNKPWRLEDEVEDFRSLDIGLYPIFDRPGQDPKWLEGKSGFKAVEYMAVGVPFVMSPVGVCAELGIAGETHYTAESLDDWYNALDKLLSDQNLREAMGNCGRKFSEANFGVDQHAQILASVLHEAVATGR